MQFKVPQFLDIEDKIFGPFTFKEFVYLAGGAGLCFVIYKAWGLVWGAIPILVVASFSIALVRYRPNNKPFINLLESAFNYSFQNKLYIWKRRENKINRGAGDIRNSEADEKRKMLETTVRLGNNKLRDLAWSLDVLDLSKHKNNL